MKHRGKRRVVLTLPVSCEGDTHQLGVPRNGEIVHLSHPAEDAGRWAAFALIGGRLPVCRQILRQFSYLYRAVDRAMNAFAFKKRTTTSVLRWDYGLRHILEWLARYESAREALYGDCLVLGEAAEMVANFSTETLKGFEEFKEMRCPSQKLDPSITSCSVVAKNTS